MTKWEYAMLSNPASGDDSVSFSQLQDPTIVQEFGAALGKGLKAERSNAGFLHLNLNHTNVVRVSGLLGERGWEMVGFSTLTGGHMYMMFRRHIAGTL